jgi:3-hydroxy-9,10-secoandrosta-1,3,5(10)-triene-9,17-dione monooxygenase reductase component
MLDPQILTEGPPAPEDMRTVMARFATGVTIVTTIGPDARPYGSTANAVSSVSLSPPLVLVCLREASETLAALRASGRFAINVLAEDQQPLAERFAKPARDGQWDGVVHRVDGTGSPLLDGTRAALECAVHDEADGGDHRIVIGRVLSVRRAEQPLAPLLFSDARYHRIGAALGLPESEPRAPEVSLPSRLGQLQVTVREWVDDGSVAMVAVTGDPRGAAGAAVYVHRACVVGDLLDACCGSRSRLHAAIGELSARSAGVVVYHRAAGSGAACEAAGGPGRPELQTGAVNAVLAAATELQLRAIHLLTDDHDELHRLVDAGLDVASTGMLTGPTR